jgi:outer membrane protein TolC
MVNTMFEYILLLAAGSALTQAPPLTINLEQALERARQYAPQFQGAVIAAGLAREDRNQARAALLPALNYFNQYLYTQGNGTPSGVFVANDGVHIYDSQALVRAEPYSFGKRAEYRRAIAAEELARARQEVARRGLVATVIQNYYALVAAQRKAVNARRSVQEAQQFVEITGKQERGGEVAHADVVKARILLEQRERDAQDAALSIDRSRIALALLLFPDFRQDFSVVDDLDTVPPLPAFPEIEQRTASSPEVRAAKAAVRQETAGISSARSGLLPTFSVDYFFGINARQIALHDQEHHRNLGSAVQGTLTIPVWTWGAVRSRVRQAELRLRQAQLDLGVTQRQLLANLSGFYGEARTAGSQLDSLVRSRDLAGESLRLTLLRYQAGDATALEVSDAQSTLAQARNAYDDGRARYRLALAELETLTGVL